MRHQELLKPLFIVDFYRLHVLTSAQIRNISGLREKEAGYRKITPSKTQHGRI